MIGQRVVVVGTSGSGKTTLAATIANACQRPHIEIDALQHGPDWQQATREELLVVVQAATDGACWVADGNYSRVRHVVWQRADMLIWLDYPLWVNLWRITGRTLRRLVFRQILWNGNRESAAIFFSRENMIFYMMKTYTKRRRRIPLQLPDYPHLSVVHLRSPRETDEWLARLRAFVGQG